MTRHCNINWFMWLNSTLMMWLQKVRLLTMGGAIRNDNGAFLFGFSKQLIGCSTVQAELWAISHGIKIAWDRGYCNILVESDSQASVCLILKGCVFLPPLFRAIGHFRHQEGRIRFQHVLRETNRVVDSLTRFELQLDNSCRIIDVVLTFIVHALLWTYQVSTDFPTSFNFLLEGLSVPFTLKNTSEKKLWKMLIVVIIIFFFFF